MTQILILGGTGYTGRLLSKLILKHTDASVTIACRHSKEAEALAGDLNESFGEKRAYWVYADAAIESSLHQAFRHQDLVIIAAPTTASTEQVVQAALGSGTDYLDIQLSAHKTAVLKSFEKEIKDSGRCFITEAGYHPGLPAVLVHHAA